MDTISDGMIKNEVAEQMNLYFLFSFLNFKKFMGMVLFINNVIDY